MLLVHKPDIPLRLIAAAIDLVSYQLAEHLSSILSPLYGNTDHHVLNSADFVESIKNLGLMRNEIMVSFDVESLFTSVPVNDVIKLTHNPLLSDESLEDRTPNPPTEIIKLLKYWQKTT